MKAEQVSVLYVALLFGFAGQLQSLSPVIASNVLWHWDPEHASGLHGAQQCDIMPIVLDRTA
jgi:hypothetical protein